MTLHRKDTQKFHTIVAFLKEIEYNPVFDSQTKQSTVEMPILPGFSNGAVSF